MKRAVVVGSGGVESKQNKTTPLTSASGDGASPPVSDRLILRDISFTVESGACVALVGPSGCGKTTLARLLVRLIDLNSEPTPSGLVGDTGSITVDGQSLTAVQRRSIVAAPNGIALVCQDSFVGNRSIRANLLLAAAPNTTGDELIQACKSACIHDRITSLKNGYDTVIGEGGARLSGGERQRLEIARVLLRRPTIVVLDEIGSGLDEALMRRVAKTVISRCKTTLLIAHRLSIVRDFAHRIQVMSEGQIIETGTHQQLMTTNGWYAQTYRQQTGDTEVLPPPTAPQQQPQSIPPPVSAAVQTNQVTPNATS